MITAVNALICLDIKQKNDVLSAEDMKRALESHGGVKGCKFIVAEVDMPSKAILKKQQNQ